MLLLNAITAPGSSAEHTPTFDHDKPATYHTLQVVFTGAPTAVVVALDGGIYPSGLYDEVAEHTVSAAGLAAGSEVFYVSAKALSAVKARLVTLTGGTTPTVSMHYIGSI